MFSKGPQKPIEAGKCNADAGTYEKIVGTLVSAYSAGRGSPASWGARALAQTDIGEGRFPYLPGRNELHHHKKQRRLLRRCIFGRAWEPGLLRNFMHVLGRNELHPYKKQ